MTKRLHTTFRLALGTIVLFPVWAQADVGVPMISILYPAFLIILIPIILVETEVFRRKIARPYKKWFWTLATANLFSTVLGYPLAWFLLFRVELLANKIHPLVATSTLGNVAMVVIGSAWLAPESKGWMVIAAAIVNLIPAYLLSVYSEAFIVHKLLKEPYRTILPLSWKANAWSYFTLIVFGGLFLFVLKMRAA